MTISKLETGQRLSAYAKAYDTVYLAGLKLPGVCKVTFQGFEDSYALSAAKGTEGAWEIYGGSPPAKFTIECKMWLVNQRAIFDKNITRKYRPKPQKKNPKPVDVYSYDLNEWGIKQAVILKMTPSQFDQFYTVTIECAQYYKPPKINNARVMKPQASAFAPSVIGPPIAPKVVAPPSALTKKP